MTWREYFLYAKKIKTTTFFFQQFVSISLSLLVSIAPFWILPIELMQCMHFCIRLNARMRYFNSNQSIKDMRYPDWHFICLADASGTHVGTSYLAFSWFRLPAVLPCELSFFFHSITCLKKCVLSFSLCVSSCFFLFLSRLSEWGKCLFLGFVQICSHGLAEWGMQL